MNEDRIYPSLVIQRQSEAIELLERENEQLKSRLKQKDEVFEKAIKHVSSLSSRGRDCMIYADVKKDILAILYKYKGDSNE